MGILLHLLQRESSTELRGALLLQRDQRNLIAERNKKQILRLLKFSAESDGRKGNDSFGFAYCPTFRDKITRSFPVGRAELNIRCSDMIWAITHLAWLCKASAHPSAVLAVQFLRQISCQGAGVEQSPACPAMTLPTLNSSLALVLYTYKHPAFVSFKAVCLLYVGEIWSCCTLY